MNSRIDEIIKELPMYERAEEVDAFLKLHDTVIHELHIELDRAYDIIPKEEIESDIKDLESYLTEVTDHHKKELLHEIIAYIEKKV
ncbi:hypothetical protein [Psychrilyobacter atlanticus]|uniref:hypothetical protein n=1 Tax=Psychrilyobacter atlanticus TaxID=271091 RepID=UPI0004124BEE|nr:hypothetical protein [Psychrilyobacter atlanticus]